MNKKDSQDFIYNTKIRDTLDRAGDIAMEKIRNNR